MRLDEDVRPGGECEARKLVCKPGSVDVSWSRAVHEKYYILKH